MTGPPTDAAMKGIARSAGEEMTQRAAAHTPKVTGTLARKWRSLPVEPTPDGSYVPGTTNPDYRAKWIERGVEPHELKPKRKRALSTPDGPRSTAAHRGFGGAHMLAKAAAEVEAELPEIAQPHMSRWQLEIELRAKRHKGIS